jgi:hypothetical protein
MSKPNKPADDVPNAGAIMLSKPNGQYPPNKDDSLKKAQLSAITIVNPAIIALGMIMRFIKNPLLWTCIIYTCSVLDSHINSRATAHEKA